MSRIVQIDGVYFLRVYLTPNNMSEVNEILPNVFNEPANSSNPEDTGCVLGSIRYDTYEQKYVSYYYNFGKSNNRADQLERVNDEQIRIAAYLYGFLHEVNPDTGVDEPYIDIRCSSSGEINDDVNMGRLKIGLAIMDNPPDTVMESCSNLVGLDDNVYLTDGQVYYDTKADADWSAGQDTIVVQTGGAGGRYLSLDIPDNYLKYSNFWLSANIPVFKSYSDAQHYILTGDIREGSCFNNPSDFSDEADNDYFIRSWTYEYNKSKSYVGHETDKHRLDIKANGNSIKGYIEEGEYHNIRLKAYGDATMEWVTFDGSTYSGTASSFNRSAQATDYNTFNQYKNYGRNGFVKGGWWDTNIYIYNDEADADMSVEHPESVLPINPYDVDETPTPRDTGDNVDTESDLTSQMHDASTGLITLYESTAAALNVLGSALYTANTSFLDGLKIYGESPINSLISVYHCPINLDSFITKEPASAFKVGSNTVTTTGANIVKTYGKIVALGSVLVNPIYNDFRDYTNLEYELHLPFSNPIILDASEIMGKTLTIKATVDPYNLQIRYYIIVNSVVYKFIDASFGKQVAVLGNDGAGKARELRQDIIGITGNAIGIAAGMASGNLVLTANNVMQATGGIYATLETEKREPKKQVVGAFANGCGENDILYPYLSITETLSIAPANLASVYGRPTNLITKLGNLRGFIAAEMPMLEVDCSDAEREELIAAISEGIIL